MHLISPLLARDDCISCPDTPVCSCSANQECFLIGRDCNTCPSFKCVAKSTSSGSSSSGGISKGALAGAIIGSLIFFVGAVLLFLWWRKTQRLRNAAGAGTEKDAPASAETVLNRPDPIEKALPSPTARSTVRVYSSSSNTTIDLDPESQAGSRRIDSPGSSVRSNPFDDNNSIRTAGTEGTNVIPIALVSPDPSQRSESSQLSGASSPIRPPRPADTLDNSHAQDMLRAVPPAYAQSQRSGLSGMSRNSYMSNASYASDFLNEAPVIMTATHGPVRQVLGVSKAEVVNASNDLKTPTSSRFAAKSPLAATSFGPSDIISEEGNPFSDRHSTATTHATSPATTTFGPLSPSSGSHTSLQSTQSTWVPDGPLLPWAKGDDDNSRPSSVSTQAGSIIDIGNATRVNVGLLGRSPSYRTTMGRLVTPSTSGTGMGTLEEQQQRAMDHAQQRAGAQNKRSSNSSAISTTADSILESFPFVPPSPISNRPMRSPPVSPLGQQVFSSPPGTPQVYSPSVRSFHEEDEESNLPSPPDRRTLGLSTGSQLSTASSGLGSFPFQIDHGNSRDSQAPTAYNGRQRASLDTLALTSDLSSYPLGFDRESSVPPMPATKRA